MYRKLFCGLAVFCFGILYAFSGSIPALILLIGAVAVPVVGIFLTLLAGKRVNLRITFSDTVEKGQSGVGVLYAENKSVIPVTRISLLIKVENSLTGEEISVPFRCSVPPLGSTKAEFDLGISYCGKLTISAKEASICDGFGLISMSLKPHVTVLRMVMPNLFPMRVRLTGSENYTGDEDFQRNQKGQDWSTPFQLRDFAQGDGMKQIHWKMSYKLNRYIVKDPSLTLDRALLVLWDIGSMPKQAPPEAFDTMAEALVAFCLSLAEDEIPYSLAWSGADNGGLELRDINSKEDFYALLPEVLCASKNIRAIDCLHALRGRRYPLVAYFSGKLSKGIAELSDIGKTTVFFCDSDGEGCAAGDLNCWIFSPFDYRSALRDVTV